MSFGYLRNTHIIVSLHDRPNVRTYQVCANRCVARCPPSFRVPISSSPSSPWCVMWVGVHDCSVILVVCCCGCCGCCVSDFVAVSVDFAQLAAASHPTQIVGRRGCRTRHLEATYLSSWCARSLATAIRVSLDSPCDRKTRICD